jgi:hypothetical protein
MLYLQHNFDNIIFKIKHKLYIASGSAPPPFPSEKFGVRTCAFRISPSRTTCDLITLTIRFFRVQENSSAFLINRHFQCPRL